MAGPLVLLAIATLGLQSSTATTTTLDEPHGSGRMVGKEQRAPVPYESVNGLVFFKATVAGREVSALLDTGATTTMVDTQFARNAGLSVAPEKKPLKTSDGEITTQSLTSEVAFVIPGQVEAIHPALATSDMSAASKGAGRKIEFVLGMDFLRRFVFMIDPARKTFQLAPSGAFRPPSDAIEIPIQGERPPKVEITVGNEKAVVILDTGAMGELALTPKAWSRIVPKDAKTGSAISSGAGGRPQASQSALLPEIQIGSLRVGNVNVHESNATIDRDGRLGMGVLGKFRLVLDAGIGRMWLGAVPPPPSEN